MEITGIIQARMGSTRLPGKSLVDIGGRPALGIQVERLKHCRHLDRLIIATTTAAQDDPLERLAQEHGVSFFRGDREDVLDRYYQAARYHHVEHICRLTGDCPLIDPKAVDQFAGYYMDHLDQYVYVASGPTHMEGSASAEFFSLGVLEQVWREARNPIEREHVTHFIRKRPQRFPIHLVECEADWGKFRVTLDEPQDLEVIRQIVSEFGYGPETDTYRMAAFLAEHPNIHRLNSKIIRNEGLARAIQKFEKGQKPESQNGRIGCDRAT